MGIGICTCKTTTTRPGLSPLDDHCFMPSSTRTPKQSPHLDRAYPNTPVVSISTGRQASKRRENLTHLAITPVISSPRQLARVARAAVPKPSVLANSGGVGRKFHQLGEKKKNLLSLRHFVFSSYWLVGCVRLKLLRSSQC
ncbi:hypothetical protein V8C34DRAFT_286410 [Trichoderma compactum]